MSTFAAEKVNHQVGFMIIHEKGGLISSGGELEYNEALADLFYKMVKEGTDKGLLTLSENEGGFKKLTVQFEDHFYVVAVSNKKIHVVKRKYYPTDPALV
ncbi:Ragulator complex protein LAMTOR4 like protein [Argiope bruennichi]|uniref:Late endosomal/lysosomal adaptor and MAPK and MTOR activator 4 n=1 Tax=Argiope bruennichi TaxID=94029 RepID=A0A8T0FRQ0_ARGBR|nr:Ragulator complex protein LAMTOR4 like protein [Argiope bruennichi]